MKGLRPLRLDDFLIKVNYGLQLFPTLMKRYLPGEGKNPIPCLLFFFLILIIVSVFINTSALAQPDKEKKLSQFDRLAEKATALNKRGQYEEVISLLEPYKNNPQNDSALFYNELGIAYRHKGKLTEAVQAYQLALARDPQNPVIMNNLGYTFYLKKEYDQAVELLQKVTRLAPFFKEAHANLSLAYYHQQKYQKALEEIDQVLKIDPDYKQARNFRENILKKIKEQKK